MTQEERLDFLINFLLREDEQYKNISMPECTDEKKYLLRALMNVRMPSPISREFLRIQDEYLGIEREQRGITDCAALPPVPADKRITLWQGDITTLKVDAIVNAANSALLGCFHPLHSCIDNMIHSRSGVQLRLLCGEIMARQGHGEPAGHAKLTPAFNLPSRYILHTVGPIINGPVTPEDEELLAGCYRSCLELAAKNGLHSVAFCCISTGEFHFPNDQAAVIAVNTVRKFLDEQHIAMQVIFNVFKDIDLRIYQKLLEVPQC